MENNEKFIFKAIKENGGKITRNELIKKIALRHDEIDDCIYNLEQQGRIKLGRGSQIYDKEDQADIWMEASIRK